MNLTVLMNMISGELDVVRYGYLLSNKWTTLILGLGDFVLGWDIGDSPQLANSVAEGLRISE